MDPSSCCLSTIFAGVAADVHCPLLRRSIPFHGDKSEYDLVRRWSLDLVQCNFSFYWAVCISDYLSEVRHLILIAGFYSSVKILFKTERPAETRPKVTFISAAESDIYIIFVLNFCLALS